MRSDSNAASLRWLGALAIAATGVGLRCLGLGFGLPAVYNPDEVAIMNRAMAFGQGDLNPHNFLYPTLYFYVLFAWEGLWFVAGWLVGVFDSVRAFEQTFFVDPSSIYLAGRLLSVVCGVATIWVVFLVARRLFDQSAGWMAAALLAVAPLAVTDAHYVKHDIPVTLLVLITHLVLARLLTDADARMKPSLWLAAGVAAGLAMSTHYYAVFVLVPLVLVAGMPVESTAVSRAHRIGLVALGAVAAFFAGSPYLLAEPGTAWRDVVANRQIVVDRATTSTGPFGSLGFYLRWLAVDAAGMVTAAAALAGIVTAWRRKPATALLLLAFPTTFVLFIANTVPGSRYLNPVVPILVIFAAAAMSRLWSQGASRRAIAVGILCVALAESTAASLRLGTFFRATDTRTIAQHWIEREVPPGTSILIQPYSVVLRPARESLIEALEHHLGSAERASIKFQRQLALDPYPSPAYRTIYLGTGGLDVDKIYVTPDQIATRGNLGELRRLGVSIVVLKQTEIPDPLLDRLRTVLRGEATLVRTFSPFHESRASTAQPFVHGGGSRLDSELARPGPMIEVWRID